MRHGFAGADAGGRISALEAEACSAVFPCPLVRRDHRPPRPVGGPESGVRHP
jgi:hypothetical protein